MKEIFSTVLLIFLMPGTAFSKVSHPPTYNEIKKCYKSEVNCEDLEEAKNYTVKEVKKLYQQMDYRFDISLAIKSFHDGDMHPLWKATQKYRDKPEVHAVFIAGILSDYNSDEKIKKNISDFPGIDEQIILFKLVDPDNSLPHYFQAYYFFLNNNYAEAKRSLEMAEKKPDFRVYTHKFIEHSVATSKFLNYPKFLAMDIGIKIAITGVRPYVFKKLGDQIDKNCDNPQRANSLKILGERLSNSCIMGITKIIGYRILFQASPTNSIEANTYNAKCKEIISLSEQFKEKSADFSEEQLVKFFDDVVKTNEVNAMKKAMGILQK